MKTLDAAVEYCVNPSARDVNTTPLRRCSHIAGINSGRCKKYSHLQRRKRRIYSRAQLKKVPKLGAKAYEQCAGFIRVPE